MKEKIITYIVLLGLVYGIFNFNTDYMWSLSINGFSYITFVIFIAYLIYSLKKAAREQTKNK